MRAAALAMILVGAMTVGSPSASTAGPLMDHPDAIAAMWTGFGPFNDGLGRTGRVEYAVFTAADFNANFSGLGYVPGDAFVYTYQIVSTGIYGDDIRGGTLNLQGGANTIGAFKIGDIPPVSAQLVGADAQWSFPTGIGEGLSSFGLAFSSPDLPKDWEMRINLEDPTAPVEYALAVSVPIPSVTPVPEPGSLVLVLAGAAIMGIRRYGNRRASGQTRRKREVCGRRCEPLPRSE